MQIATRFRVSRSRLDSSLLAAACVAAGQLAQVKLIDHFYDEAGQMLLRQPFLNRRRQEHRRVAIDGSKLG